MTESKMGKRQRYRNKCFCCLSSKPDEKQKPFLLSSWSLLSVCEISLLFFKFSAWTRRSLQSGRTTKHKHSFCHFWSSGFRFHLSPPPLIPIWIMSQGSDAGQRVLSSLHVFSITVRLQKVQMSPTCSCLVPCAVSWLWQVVQWVEGSWSSVMQMSM